MRELLPKYDSLAKINKMKFESCEIKDSLSRQEIQTLNSQVKEKAKSITFWKTVAGVTTLIALAGLFL